MADTAKQLTVGDLKKVIAQVKDQKITLAQVRAALDKVPEAMPLTIILQALPGVLNK